MEYKPQDLFLSFYNFFSIALPGAILTQSIITSGLNQWVFPKISVVSGSPEAWVAFFVSSYFVGHFAQLIASPLDNIYDQWYEKHKTKQSSSLKDAAKQARNEILDKYETLKDSKGTFPYARNYITAIDKSMDVKLENIEAESKFFRSLTIILFLSAIMFIRNQVVTVVFTYIFLAVVSCWRFLDLRWKHTQRTYQYFVVASAIKKRGEEKP
jgi:hypothetical protein